MDFRINLGDFISVCAAGVTVLWILIIIRTQRTKIRLTRTRPSQEVAMSGWLEHVLYAFFSGTAPLWIGLAVQWKGMVILLFILSIAATLWSIGRMLRYVVRNISDLFYEDVLLKLNRDN